ARNVELLKREIEKYPESADLMYQTAKSVYVAEGAESSIEYYERALSLNLDPSRYWVRDLCICYGYVLLELERYEQALSLEAVYDDMKDYADYRFLMGLIYMNNGLFDKAVSEFITCTQMNEDKTKGTNSYKAWYNAGVIEECLGHSDMAMTYYHSAGQYEPAIEGIKRIGKNKP
ncbi:MAG: glycosyl transferase family 2, partial [Eubacterium sp.]|nr:glycosyl transferase family 2 [Eubacterium sp.]